MDFAIMNGFLTHAELPAHGSLAVRLWHALLPPDLLHVRAHGEARGRRPDPSPTTLRCPPYSRSELLAFTAWCGISRVSGIRARGISVGRPECSQRSLFSCWAIWKLCSRCCRFGVWALPLSGQLWVSKDSTQARRHTACGRLMVVGGGEPRASCPRPSPTELTSFRTSAFFWATCTRTSWRFHWTYSSSPWARWHWSGLSSFGRGHGGLSRSSLLPP